MPERFPNTVIVRLERNFLDAAGARAREPPRAAARWCREDAATRAGRRARARASGLRGRPGRGRRGRDPDGGARSAARAGGRPLSHERPLGRLRGVAAGGRAAVPGRLAARARGCAAGPARAAGDPQTEVRRLALESGWLERPPEGLGEREQTRQADLTRLIALAESFEGGAEAFAAWLDGRFGAAAVGGVNLLTLRRAKGLEFEAVFVVRVSEGELPIRRGEPVRGTSAALCRAHPGEAPPQRHLGRQAEPLLAGSARGRGSPRHAVPARRSCPTDLRSAEGVAARACPGGRGACLYRLQQCDARGDRRSRAAHPRAACGRARRGAGEARAVRRPGALRSRRLRIYPNGLSRSV